MKYYWNFNIVWSSIIGSHRSQCIARRVYGPGDRMVIELLLLLLLREQVENMKPGRKPIELLDSLQNILGKIEEK